MFYLSDELQQINIRKYFSYTHKRGQWTMSAKKCKYRYFFEYVQIFFVRTLPLIK